MKIGINARTFSVSEPDGEVQSAIKLVSTMIERFGHEHEFVIFGHRKLKLKNLFRFNLYLDSKFYFINSQTWGLAWEQILPLLAKKHKIDVLLSPTSNGPMFAPKSFNFKNVVWIHDVNQFYKGYSSTIYKIFSSIRCPMIAKCADIIITVSEFSKKEISKYLHVPESKIKVVYNGIDDLFISDNPGKAIELPEKYILYVGTSHPRKNLHRLIQAYSKIKDHIEEKLVIIGPKPRRVFSEINLNKYRSEDIIVKGFVSPEELKYAYQNASVFVYPSLYEGFGLPPLEALACGTPVVVSKIPPFLEVLGDFAHYVDPYNIDDIAQGIIKVLQESFSQRKVNNGKQYARQFTWEKTSKAIEKILYEVTE